MSLLQLQTECCNGQSDNRPNICHAGHWDSTCNNNNNNNNRLTAFVPGQPGYAGTRRNTLPSALA